MSLLEIRDLSVHLPVPGGMARALDGVDLDMDLGETVGLVGESGSGKTMLALALLGLLPGDPGAIQVGGTIGYKGKNLLEVEPTQLRAVRGGEVAMIFQEPMISLNPVFTVGRQVRESVVLHRGMKGRAAREEVVRLLSEVGIEDADERQHEYPHQFSGGMRQRVMIAMALAGDPKLLVADEPTTALDVVVEGQILSLLKDLQERRGMGLLLISHDLDVVARVCRRTVVLYGGRVVESGLAEEVLSKPVHPYTRGLVGSRLNLHDRRQSLRPIPGDVPEATDWPSGCRFHPRCGQTHAPCRTHEPPLASLGDGGGIDGIMDRGVQRFSRCWLHFGEAAS